MAHLILTRFNSIPVDPIQRKKGKFLDPAWLRNRLALVKKFFRPSLENQTLEDFTLVVAVHPDTPKKIQAYFEEFAEITYGQITEWPISPGDITTRLDSDDMIHREFVERVQAARGKKPLLVDFHTAQYDANTGQFYKINRNGNNSQFLSVAGSTPELHCYSSSHTNMPRLFENQIRIPIFGGIQVVHQDNIFTTSFSGPKISLNQEDYGL